MKRHRHVDPRIDLKRQLLDLVSKSNSPESVLFDENLSNGVLARSRIASKPDKHLLPLLFRPNVVVVMHHHCPGLMAVESLGKDLVALLRQIQNRLTHSSSKK